MMKPEALKYHKKLPASVHRATGQLLTLDEVLANPASALKPSELTEDQQVTLARARWQAGEWSDLIYDLDQEINLDRALQEVDARSDIGRFLLRIEMRSVEMVLEDAAGGQI